MNTMGTFEAYRLLGATRAILDRQANQASQNLQATDTRNSNLGKSNTAALLDDPSEVRQVLVEDAKNMVARADGDSRRFLVGLADVVRTLRSADGRKAVIFSRQASRPTTSPENWKTSRRQRRSPTALSTRWT